MNIKKIVSAITAFALSASVFAGFGVTASAAADEGYKYGEVLFGTTTETDGTITDVAVQTDFTENAETMEAAITHAGTTFLEGSVLLGSDGITKNFTTPVSSGKVRFAVNYKTLGGFTNHITLVDSDGNAVVTLYPADSSGSATINMLSIGGTGVASAWVYTPRNVAYMLNDLTIDFDAQTYSYSMTACTGGSSGTVNKVTPVTGEGTLSGVKDIAGIKTKANASNAYRMDNIYLYSLESTATLYDYTVNYTVDGSETPVKVISGKVADGTVINTDSMFEEDGTRYYITAETAPTLTVTSEGENVLNVPVRVAEIYEMKAVASTDAETVFASATVVEGDAFSYAYPKYLTDANGKVIDSCNEATYSVTKTPTASETIEIPYTAYEGTAYFAEAEVIGGGATQDNANYSKNRAVRATDAGATAFTIGETAYYSITVAGACRNTGSSSVFAVYKNSVADENLVFNGDMKGASMNTVQEDGIKTSEESVLLKAGDVIILQGDSGNTWVDYILVTKTGEAPSLTVAVAETDGETALPAATAATAIYNADGTAANTTYGELTADMVVKTVYAKVANTEDAPVVSIGGVVQESVWTQVGTTGIYFAQFVGTEADFAEGGEFETVVITCGDLAETIAWTTVE